MSDWEATSKPCVVVVNFGSHELLARNIGPLSDIATVVVVDNYRSASDSKAVSMLAEARGWDVIVNAQNVGFGTAVNAGISHGLRLGHEAFVIVNPDLQISTSVLLALHERVLRDPLTMVSPVVHRPDGRPWFEGAVVLVSRGRTSTARGSDSSGTGGWLSGACLAVHASLWERVAGFDDRYFLYWEDVDLSWRCMAVGGRLEVDRALTVVHDVGGTQAGEGKSSTYVYYNCRNRLLFAARHLNRSSVLLWLLLSPTYAYRVALRGGRRAFLRGAVPLAWAAARGTVVGAIFATRLLIGGRNTPVPSGADLL